MTTRSTPFVRIVSIALAAAAGDVAATVAVADGFAAGVTPPHAATRITARIGPAHFMARQYARRLGAREPFALPLHRIAVAHVDAASTKLGEREFAAERRERDHMSDRAAVAERLGWIA